MTHFPITEYEELTDPKAKEVYEEILTELGLASSPTCSSQWQSTLTY